MPAHVEIIHAREFIRARPEGVLHIEESLRLLLEIAKSAADLKAHEVILSRKTAVLCSIERFDRARFFAMSAEDKGFNIRAFTDYEAAIKWILFDEKQA